MEFIIIIFLPRILDAFVGLIITSDDVFVFFTPRINLEKHTNKYNSIQLFKQRQKTYGSAESPFVHCGFRLLTFWRKK